MPIYSAPIIVGYCWWSTARWYNHESNVPISLILHVHGFLQIPLDIFIWETQISEPPKFVICSSWSSLPGSNLRKTSSSFATIMDIRLLINRNKSSFYWCTQYKVSLYGWIKWIKTVQWQSCFLTRWAFCPSGLALWPTTINEHLWINFNASAEHFLQAASLHWCPFFLPFFFSVRKINTYWGNDLAPFSFFIFFYNFIDLAPFQRQIRNDPSSAGDQLLHINLSPVLIRQPFFVKKLSFDHGKNVNLWALAT